MQIVVSGIPVDVQKKNIKNMHLSVKPPDGHVVLSAPKNMDDKALEIFIRTNLRWVKNQIEEFRNQPRSGKRQYVSGETIYFWGKQYFIKFVPDNKKNSLVLDGDTAILSMSKDSTVKQREKFVREQYREKLKAVIQKLLPKWERMTGLHADSWQTKYMITRWGTCNVKARKLWFNIQLAQKPLICLNFVILHELLHFHTPRHDATFIAYMDKYMPNWRDVRRELNERKLDYYESQDESPLKKLIDNNRYDEIKLAVINYLKSDADLANKQYKPDESDVTIENVVRIEQTAEGIISFTVIASSTVESLVAKKSGQPRFLEKWISLRCEVTIGIELTDFRIVSVSPCEIGEDSEDDRFSDELVPIISHEDFDKEATRFLEKYYPRALEEPVPIPIRQIAEDAMHLKVIEDTRLSEKLSVFGIVVFEDGKIVGSDRKVLISKATRGTMYIDPRVYYEKTYGTVNSTIAHECYHWHRHQPYHALMKMLGVKDEIGKAIRCAISPNEKNKDKWNSVDWLEWQANNVALHILMPEKTCRMKVEQLLAEYVNNADAKNKHLALKYVISELAQFYGVSLQAAKARMRQLGYTKVDGILTYIDGRYIPPFSFKPEAIGKNQTFTLSSTDLFKAYTCNKAFRELVDSGFVLYVDGHLCVNDSRYIEYDDDGVCHMSEYALAHVDECCFVFDQGYTYDSKYQGDRNYAQFLAKSAPPFTKKECSYDPDNPHNRGLKELMDGAKDKSNALRRYPGSFAETLVQLMKSRKLSNKKLADLSLVGEKTIQRLRNDEEYPGSKQTVLALCVGMSLSPPEAKDLFDKSDFKLNTQKHDDYIYMCVLMSCSGNSIYAVNEMLISHGVAPLGSALAA